MSWAWCVLRWLVRIAVVAGASIGLAVYAGDLSGAVATRLLQDAGFPDAEVVVTDIGLNASRATVWLDKAGAVGGTVAIDHPWRDLLDGRVARVVVSKARVRLDVAKDGGVRLAGLALMGGGEGGSGAGLPANELPVDEFRVEDGAVTLVTPHGTATASIRLSMARQGAEHQGQATVTAPAKGLPALAVWTGGAAVSEAAGTLSLKARFRWGGEGLMSQGDLLVREVAGRFGPVAVGGVNGVVKLSSLYPPVVPKGQTLAVKLLDVGLPLTDGTIRFGLSRGGRLDVERAEWNWAGGLVRAEPFGITPDRLKGTIDLKAEGVHLGPLLALAAVEGLDATGTVSGHLPVRIAGDEVHLDGGVLEADGPGTLRYDPSDPPGFLQGPEGSPTDLLMGALTDFRYDSLRATIDGQAGGDLGVGIAIRGANPAFYDGYPVALNLKVSGALDRILRQSLEAYRIPDAVRDRMTEFERKTP